jgi:hypothetical protein
MSWNLVLGSSPRRNERRRLRQRYCPRLDALEDRTVLSPVTFYVDDSVSTLTLAARVSGYGLTLALQGQDAAGHSLTTGYTGTIAADVNLGAGTITLQADGTSLTADNSGNWQPQHDGSAGSEPANYGGRVTVFGASGYAAVRDVMVGASTNGSEALTAVDTGVYTFPSTERLTLLAGSVAGYLPRVGGGSLTLHGTASTTNQATDAATLYDLGDGTFYLVAPVQVTFSYSYAGFTALASISGQIAGVGIPDAGPAVSRGHAAQVGIALAAHTPGTVTSPVMQAPMAESVETVQAAAQGVLPAAQDGRPEGGVWEALHHRVEASGPLAAIDAALLDLVVQEIRLN